MATVNKVLEQLSFDDVAVVSEHYLLGWRDLEKTYGFRLKGLNRKRESYGLAPVTDVQSVAYRTEYVHSHYSQDEIESALFDYLSSHKMDRQRWVGVDLFGCHFSGKSCISVLRSIVGHGVFDDVSEKCRVMKLTGTQTALYGGVGLGGQQTFDKAQSTLVSKYGVDNPMYIDAVKHKVKSPFCDEDVVKKAAFSRWQAMQDELHSGSLSKNFTSGRIVSGSERLVYFELVNRYGRDDVFYSYGIHPYDKRYPFNCDFYIKSEDLFIELNLDYSHGGHWFDEMDVCDVQRRKDMMGSSKNRTLKAVDIWTVSDVKKRQCAMASGIRYLVFWDNSQVQYNYKRYPRISDFYEWLDAYGCDYDRFVQVHPENTY